jgi:hypothetical protein
MFGKYTIKGGLTLLPLLAAGLLGLVVPKAVAEPIHYQERIALNCKSDVCTGSYSTPGYKINIRALTCNVWGMGAYLYGVMQAGASYSGQVGGQFVWPIYSGRQSTTTAVSYMTNQNVDLEGDGFYFGFWVNGAYGGSCSVTGTWERIG